MDPSVGWEKTVWYGAREVRVFAYTNTTDTYQLQLPANVTWIDCLVVGGGWGGDGIVIIRFAKPGASGFVIFVR